MIDRQLNYGRDLIRRFVAEAGSFRTALDIGAGSGDDLLSARAVRPEAEMHAIEVWPPSVQRLTAQGIIVHRLDLERDPFPLADESIDLVIANQVLEHVKEIFWIFHEITRVLPLGGHLIVGVPNLASLHNRLLLLLGKQPTPLQNASAHVRGYTRHDLLRFVNLVFPGGYTLVASGGSNFYPFPPAVARPLARLFPNMAWGLFLLFRKDRSYAGEFLEFPKRERLETNFVVGQSSHSTDGVTAGLPESTA